MATLLSSSNFCAEKKLIFDLSPFLKIYNDDTVHRLVDSPYVPPLHRDPVTGVSSRDTVTVPPTRIFMPQLKNSDQKLPILVHYHAGGFCVGSAFSETDLKYLNHLSSNVNAIIVSVEYPLAPERKLPAAYDDSWAALRWVCSHVLGEAHFEKDPWIANHADFDQIFVIGDSAGANIAHNMVMRAGSDPLPGNLKIKGLIANHPYFWGSIPIGGNEFEAELEKTLGYRVWEFVYPEAPGGIDNPMINPIGEGAPCLSRLACSKVFFSAAENDTLKERAVAYWKKVKECRWRGEMETVEVAGEDHCFHIFDPESENSKFLFRKMASFVNSR